MSSLPSVSSSVQRALGRAQVMRDLDNAFSSSSSSSASSSFFSRSNNDGVRYESSNKSKKGNRSASATISSQTGIIEILQGICHDHSERANSLFTSLLVGKSIVLENVKEEQARTRAASRIRHQVNREMQFSGKKRKAAENTSCANDDMAKKPRKLEGPGRISRPKRPIINITAALQLHQLWKAHINGYVRSAKSQLTSRMQRAELIGASIIIIESQVLICMGWIEKAKTYFFELLHIFNSQCSRKLRGLWGIVTEHSKHTLVTAIVEQASIEAPCIPKNIVKSERALRLVRLVKDECVFAVYLPLTIPKSNTETLGEKYGESFKNENEEKRTKNEEEKEIGGGEKTLVVDGKSREARSKTRAESTGNFCVFYGSKAKSLSILPPEYLR